MTKVVCLTNHLAHLYTDMVCSIACPGVMRISFAYVCSSELGLIAGSKI